MIEITYFFNDSFHFLITKGVTKVVSTTGYDDLPTCEAAAHEITDPLFSKEQIREIYQDSAVKAMNDIVKNLYEPCKSKP